MLDALAVLQPPQQQGAGWRKSGVQMRHARRQIGPPARFLAAPVVWWHHRPPNGHDRPHCGREILAWRPGPPKFGRFLSGGGRENPRCAPMRALRRHLSISAMPSAHFTLAPAASVWQDSAIQPTHLFRPGFCRYLYAGPENSFAATECALKARAGIFAEQRREPSSGCADSQRGGPADRRLGEGAPRGGRR